MLERLVATAGQAMRVRKLGGNRAGEIRLSRFLRNAAIDPQAMIDEAALRTASRCADRHIRRWCAPAAAVVFICTR
ncbi:hypothetical protein [Rhizobium leguminosarum]|uniref:hypothetical protein n=1 Tax=Rhizobium leguminosarum TaxID=384 RepID=UPI001F24C64A|nr:hypothetical protein [Rhizobium leguminosarum]